MLRASPQATRTHTTLNLRRRRAFLGRSANCASGDQSCLTPASRTSPPPAARNRPLWSNATAAPAAPAPSSSVRKFFSLRRSCAQAHQTLGSQSCLSGGCPAVTDRPLWPNATAAPAAPAASSSVRKFFSLRRSCAQAWGLSVSLMPIIWIAAPSRAGRHGRAPLSLRPPVQASKLLQRRSCA